ncbi:DUF6123 family protein [Bacillus pinisoli]|uniref:DUF6123 family protein n=1 Tax=Bacillus pinisoli TaxID=2901866 RepID=UPI001FF5D2F4
MAKVEEYLQFLRGKGFIFREEELGFISFGQLYSGTNDAQVIAAIEITLKAQKHFDGSYFVALLEHLKSENISKRKIAYQYAKEKGII